jgi:hypothetical protein
MKTGLLKYLLVSLKIIFLKHYLLPGMLPEKEQAVTRWGGQPNLRNMCKKFSGCLEKVKRKWTNENVYWPITLYYTAMA